MYLWDWRLTVFQSATAIAFVMMAAAKHPDIQARVQEQLDKVVGQDRCKPYIVYTECKAHMTAVVPTFDDERDLPLVVAFYLEAYRWRPVSYGGNGIRIMDRIIVYMILRFRSPCNRRHSMGRC